MAQGIDVTRYCWCQGVNVDGTGVTAQEAEEIEDMGIIVRQRKEWCEPLNRMCSKSCGDD